MTNVLIPTDFTAASLQLAAQAVQKLNRPVNVVLFHAFEMPFYYQDMIRPEHSVHHHLVTDEFRQHCKQLKEQYPQLINRISVKYMQGDSNAVFRNFIEANAVDIIACPAGYAYIKIHPSSLNPVPFFKKSGLTLLQDFTIRERNTNKKETLRAVQDYSTATS